MGNDKTNIFLVAIVGIVAVAGLVFLFSGRGNATAADSISGEAIFEPSKTIQKNDLFILPVGAVAPTTTSTVGEILQYKGADKSNVKKPKIKFNQWSTGETLEYAVENGQAKIKLGGKQFEVKLINPAKIDSPLQIDLDENGAIDSVSPAKFFGTGPYGVKGLGYTCKDVVTMLEGENATLKDGGEINLIYIDPNNAKINLLKGAGGEPVAPTKPPLIKEGATWGTASGYDFHLINIFYQAYAGGVHQATFCVNY